MADVFMQVLGLSTAQKCHLLVTTLMHELSHIFVQNLYCGQVTPKLKGIGPVGVYMENRETFLKIVLWAVNS